MYSCTAVEVAGDWNTIPSQPHIQPVAMTLSLGQNQTFTSFRNNIFWINSDSNVVFSACVHIKLILKNNIWNCCKDVSGDKVWPRTMLLLAIFISLIILIVTITVGFVAAKLFAHFRAVTQAEEIERQVWAISFII